MRWFVVSIALLALILVPFVLFENQFNAIADSVIGGDVSSWYSATAIAVLHGAALVRTHDVAETRDAVRVAERVRR